MTQDAEFYIINSIKQWSESHIDQHELFKILEFERDSIEGFIKDVRHIKQRLMENK